MEILTKSDIEKLTAMPFPSRVTRLYDKLVIILTKANPAQDSNVVVKVPSYSVDEDRRYEPLGVYFEEEKLSRYDREYVVVIPPTDKTDQEFVDYFIEEFDNYVSTYLSRNPNPTYFYYDGEYLLKEDFLNVYGELSERYPDIQELAQAVFALRLDELHDMYMEELDSNIPEGTYTYVKCDDMLPVINQMILTYTPLTEVTGYIDSEVKSRVRGVRRPLIIYPPSEEDYSRVSRILGNYLYFKHQIVSYFPDHPYNPYKIDFHQIHLSLMSNPLGRVIRNLQGLPDLAVLNTHLGATSSLVLLKRERLEIKAVTKYIYFNDAGSIVSDTIEIASIDYSKVRVLDILDHYNLRSPESLLYDVEANRIFRNDIIAFQRMLPDSDPPLEFRNTVLFYYKERLCLGYVKELIPTVEALLIPMSESLTPIDITLNFTMIENLVPLDWVLNIKAHLPKVKQLIEIHALRHPGRRPQVNMKVQDNILEHMFLKLSSYPGYPVSSVSDFEGWALFSPIANEYRKKIYPEFAQILDMRKVKEDGELFNFFLCNVETPSLYLKAEMIKG